MCPDDCEVARGGAGGDVGRMRPNPTASANGARGDMYHAEPSYVFQSFVWCGCEGDWDWGCANAH
jgi:hypothetical protein